MPLLEMEAVNQTTVTCHWCKAGTTLSWNNKTINKTIKQSCIEGAIHLNEITSCFSELEGKQMEVIEPDTKEGVQ